MKRLLFLLFFPVHIGLFAQQIDFRAWQFHALDTSYMRKAIDLAPEYNITSIVMSHGALSNAMELYQEKFEPNTISNQGAQLKAIANYARKKEIETHIWIHELADIPEKFKVGKRVNLDDKKLWKYLTQRYEAVFKDYPEFAGMQITFHETEFKIFDDAEVVSKMSQPERFAKLIKTVFDVCKKYDKKLIVRTFLYESEEYDWVKEGLLKSDNDIIIQTKCAPNDWQPFFPHNAMIGAFPNKKQIIEYDASAEYMGRNFIVWAAPHYFQYRWKYAVQYPQVIGYNVRLDHSAYDALFTPNEINIYALAKLAENPDYDMEKLWRDWAHKKYGANAAKAAIEILKPTYDMVNKVYFPQGVWFGNHSKLTHFEYGENRIPYIAHWDESWQPVVDKLMNPTEEVLRELVTEKDSALLLTQQSLWKLHESQDLFKKEDFQDLNERLLFQLHFTLLAKSNVKLHFGVKMARVDKKYIPYVVDELKVFRAYGSAIPEFIRNKKNNWLLDPLVVEKVAKRIENQLNQLD
ncbi:hypothetical protein [Flexithrix dorotheae]|uniref:hypothetical protein n=1 Tax=Flexithrix dorotheae TaxID=70993 RepID=UPI0003638AF7|nr:hypothetical protein [Flexithrix dorotheae]